MLTKRNSEAESTLAACTLLNLLFLAVHTIFKVVRLGYRSKKKFGTSTYQLYKNISAVKKWGLLYAQYRAGSVSYLIPLWATVVTKSLFVGCAHQAPTVQAIALFILDLSFSVLTIVWRPYALSTANAWSVTISTITTLNSVLLLLFSDIFGLPPLATGVSGILFFFMNALFLTAILLNTITVTILALLSENPDQRYVQLLDDRSSFIKTTRSESPPDELLDLVSVARGSRDHLMTSIGASSAAPFESVLTMDTRKTESSTTRFM